MIGVISRLLAVRLVWQGLKARRGRPPRDSTTRPPGPPEARPPSVGVASPGNGAQVPRDGGGVPVQTGEGPGPDSPLELDPLDWKQTAMRAVKEIKDDRATMIAAGMAYYGFLALFPALIAAVGILGLIDAPDRLYESMEKATDSALPAGASDLVGEAIANARDPKEDASLVAALIGTAVALWSASSGLVALQKGLNVAYDIQQERKFLKARLVAFALIVAIGLLGGVPSPFFTFGDTTLFTAVGWILTVAAVMVLFSLFYYLGPNRDSPRWTWVSPGGIVGAGMWLLVSAAFAIYVENFSSYGKTYGTLAGVVVLILWLFLTSLSVLVGAELNAELERQAAAAAERTPART
ncbi:MAG: YihY/virulence factor BrkB family protein [Actinomycetota bacterium]